MIRVRFAPSPTGSPHIGNIRTAIFDWLYARHTDGKFILRIEDTDQARYVEGALDEMMNDLRWMGMQWDEGPEAGGEVGPYFQSERLDIYKKYADQLIAEGKAYKCYCTSERLTEMREAQQAAGKPTGYDRRCRNLSDAERAELEAAGGPYVVRFAMPESGTSSYFDVVRDSELSFDNSLQDDFVMLKSDGFPTYNFASVIDDHLMEISHVFRGEEYISSMPKYIYLYAALGWEQPVWVHVPLILGPDKSKLSKRHGAVNFSSYIEEGYLPEAMINYLALLGWSAGEDRDLYSVDDLVERFDIKGIINHPAIFDSAKLLWMNGVYIRQSSIERLTELCLPYLAKAGLEPDAFDPGYVRKVIGLVQERLKLLSEVAEMTEFFFKDDLTFEQKGIDKWLAKPETPAVLEHVAERLEALPDWSVEALEATVREAGAEVGAEGGKVIHPVRVSVTGRTTGPGLFETMEALGREKVVARLRAAAKKTF
jgi:glutamyl-tRNA synthetase